MIYEISHRTAYRYEVPVTQSQHIVHLAPRAVERQTVRHHSLLIEPAPSTRTDLTDYFGNPFSILSIDDEPKASLARLRIAIKFHRHIARDTNERANDVGGCSLVDTI